MTDLTAKQSQVLRFLTNQSRQGRSPTVREISQHFGFSSPNAAMCHLIALEKKHYIRLPHDRSSRGIHVVGQTKSRSDVERQLYDALQSMIGIVNDINEGVVPLSNRVMEALERAYEAVNKADEEPS